MEEFYPIVAEVLCGKHFDFDNMEHVSWLKKKISSFFSRGMVFFGLYYEEDPIGYAALDINEQPGFPNVKAELHQIGIQNSLRRKSMGTMLLTHVENYAREKGVYCMLMSTYAADYKVIAFYGKNGFVPVATIPDVHGPGDEGIVYMRKILK